MSQKDEKSGTYLFLEIPVGSWGKRGVEKEEKISLFYSQPLLLKFKVDKWSDFLFESWTYQAQQQNRVLKPDKLLYYLEMIFFIQSMYIHQ